MCNESAVYFGGYRHQGGKIAATKVFRELVPKVDLDSFSLVEAAFRKVWFTPYFVELPTGVGPSK